METSIEEISSENSDISVSIVMGGRVEPPSLPENTSDDSDSYQSSNPAAVSPPAFRIIKKPDPLENIPNYEKLPPRIAESLRKLAG